MKYENGRKYRRKIGQPRKDYNIRNNLGHSFDITNKEVVFMGKTEKSYCLTIGKKYTILDTMWGKSCYDKELKNKFESNKRKYHLNSNQSEEEFIIIINDKGHKRKYSHLMFKKSEESK